MLNAFSMLFDLTLDNVQKVALKSDGLMPTFVGVGLKCADSSFSCKHIIQRRTASNLYDTINNQLN